MSNLFYDVVKASAAIPLLIALRPKWIYKNPDYKRIFGGVIYIANHHGYVDPILLMTAIWYRRHRFICTKEFYDKPITRFLFTQFHCIPIDRDNFSVNSYKDILKALKQGEVVSMFPEGHMVLDTQAVQSFKSGMILMAVHSGVPIVPVYLAPRKNIFKRMRFVIGEPFYPQNMYGKRPTVAQIDEMAEILLREEEGLKNYGERF